MVWGNDPHNGNHLHWVVVSGPIGVSAAQAFPDTIAAFADPDRALAAFLDECDAAERHWDQVKVRGSQLLYGNDWFEFECYMAVCRCSRDVSGHAEPV